MTRRETCCSLTTFQEQWAVSQFILSKINQLGDRLVCACSGACSEARTQTVFYKPPKLEVGKLRPVGKGAPSVWPANISKPQMHWLQTTTNTDIFPNIKKGNTILWKVS